VQVKLLRLLQEKEYQPLGSTRSERADVRFVAATHRDLSRMVADKSFREDLYYRLNVLPIELPPLRARREDIADLARGFCAELGRDAGRPELRLSEEALARLALHDWPGNVRELANVIERLVVFTDGDDIAEADVGRELGRDARVRSKSPPSDEASLVARRNEAERQAVVDALERAQGNRTKAARLLGISRRSLYKRLSEFGLMDPRDS
jgi:DNA-binding NtrC family response regulator